MLTFIGAGHEPDQVTHELLPHITSSSTARPGTVDGTIEEHLSAPQDQTGIPAQFIYYDSESGRLEVPLMLAEGIADEIEAPVAMIEVHPTHERLEVGVVWLNDVRPQ